MAQPSPVRFGVIGDNHAHIYGQIDLLVRAGAELAMFYAQEPDLAAQFVQRYLQARQDHDQRAILEDPSIQLITTAAMQHGKDVLSDKRGFTRQYPRRYRSPPGRPVPVLHRLAARRGGGLAGGQLPPSHRSGAARPGDLAGAR